MDILVWLILIGAFIYGWVWLIHWALDTDGRRRKEGRRLAEETEEWLKGEKK